MLCVRDLESDRIGESFTYYGHEFGNSRQHRSSETRTGIGVRELAPASRDASIRVFAVKVPYYTNMDAVGTRCLASLPASMETQKNQTKFQKSKFFEDF